MQGLIESLRFALELTEAKATPKQAAYAHSLAKKHPDAWTKMAAGYGLSPSPTEDDFKQMDKKEISKVIDMLINQKPASPKQIGFALSLMLQIGSSEWKESGLEKLYGRPSSASLRKMTMPEISHMIDDMKAWAWN